jgi:hypothetical protein
VTKRLGDLGAKVQIELSLTAKGSTAHITPGSSTADIIGSGSSGKKHIHGHAKTQVIP